MKATEMQIGDWYDWYAEGKNYHYKVTKETFSNDDAAIANFEPIPLTPEILEKNPNVKELGYWDEGRDVFRLFAVPIINQWWVHTLQHALRLCGLDDIADNFKV